MTRHKYEPWEARNDIGQVNADYLLTTGTKVEKREFHWGEDSDIRHKVRRQPDIGFYDAEEPLKRGHAEEVSRLDRDTWHVGQVKEGRDWTVTPLTRTTRGLQAEATRITGIPAGVKVEEWSMIPLRCSVCWAELIKEGINDDGGRLPSLADKARFCGATCRRAADAARKARKRRSTRKYPRDHRGWYVNTGTPWPRSGVNYAPSPRRPELRRGVMRGVRRAEGVKPWPHWSDTRKSILTSGCPVFSVIVGGYNKEATSQSRLLATLGSPRDSCQSSDLARCSDYPA